MELGEYYEEITKMASAEEGFNGVDEELVDGAVEILKQAGLIEDEVEEPGEAEKIACVTAVCEQLDIDEIGFDSDDEKIAAAIMIVDGYEDQLEKDAGAKALGAKVLGKIKGAAKSVDDKIVGGLKNRNLRKEFGEKATSKATLNGNLRRAAAYGGAAAGTLGAGALLKGKKKQD